MRTIFKHLAIVAALTVSAVALAQESSVSGVKVDKYATYDRGMGEITIEAFATGLKVKTITESHVPTDIVLVLDVSGSMGDKITFNGKTEVTSGELSTDKSYKVIIDGKEYYLKGFKTYGTSTDYKAKNDSWTYDKVNKGTYYYKDSDGKYYEVYADYDTSGYGKNAKKSNYNLYYYKSSYFSYEKIYLTGTGTSSTKKGVNSASTTIYTGNLYTKESKTGYTYSYRYGTSEPTSSTSGSEFYTGTTNFVVGTTPTELKYQIFTSSSTSVTKLSALQNSVCDFINQIAADAATYDVEHRISIVKFAGTTTNTIGNSTYSGGYNNSQIINGFLSAKDNADKMKKTINSLVDGGGTRASDGMAHAKDLIMGNSSRNLQGSDAYYKSKGIDTYGKVVVMFTDGEPGDYGFNSSYRSKSDYTNGWYVANNAIATSKQIKASGATVYTIGVITNPSDDVKHYLDLLSSDYPTAEKGFNISSKSTSRITTYPKEDDGFYQMSSGADLSDIFQSIANESSSGGAIKTELDASTVLKDIIDPDFNLPPGASVNDIKIYVAKCTGCTPDPQFPDDADKATYTFSTQLNQVFGKGTGTIITPDPASPGFSNVKAVAESKDGMDKISVTGFSYKDYWCGNENNNGTRVLHAGYKLIIKIPFTITNCREDQSVYETNEPDSGLYTDSGKKKVVGLPIPKLYGIIIMKSGLLDGETAIFKVYKKVNGSYETNPSYTTMIVGDAAINSPDIQVIAAMMDGQYKVVEDTDWSWTYNNDKPSVEHQLSESDNVIFAFTNTKKTGDDDNEMTMNAEATVTNVMGTESSQSASSR